MLTQAVELAAGVLVLLLPGLALLLALGIRERLLLAGLAAPVTAGVVLAATIVAGLINIRFALWSFILLAALMCTLAWVVRRFLPHRARGVAIEVASTAEVTGADRNSRAALTGALLIAQITGGLIAFAGVAFASWTWKRGLGSWSTPTQEHDPITHSVITKYINLTGHAAPWEIAPIDIITDKPIVYYPAGFPSLSALASQIVGEPMTALNLVTVAALAVAWPLSVAALAAAAVRLSGLGKGWTDLAGGIAALVAAFLYRPGISFAHDGGILPNAIAMVLAPGLVGAILVLGKRRWAAAIAIGVGAAGAVSVHPSFAATAMLTLVAAWAGLLLTKSGRHRLHESITPLLLSGAVALLLIVPILGGLFSLGGVGGSARPDTSPTPLGEAVWNAAALTYRGFWDPTGAVAQLTIGVLAIVGGVTVIIFRRGWPILTMYLFWVAVSVSFQLSPRSGPGSAIGGFFYAVFTRIQSHVSLVVPALVAGLFVFSAAAVTGLRKLPALRPARFLAAVGVVLVVLVVLTVTTLIPYARTNIVVLAERYVHPEFTRYDESDYAAVDWLRQHMKPGEVIMNSANDGSTLAYVEDGLPILNILPVSHPDLPDSIELLRAFDTYPHDSTVRALLREENIRWVYVDAQAPLIGADPSAWHGQATYEFAPGLENLAGLPGLAPAFVAGHVTVYHLDLDAVSRLS